MSEHWLSFLALLCVQFLVFIALAYRTKRLREIPTILGFSLIIGLAVGLTLDYTLGKFLEFHTYTFGFSPFFIIINGAFSYGLFVATVLLLQRLQTGKLFLATAVITGIYEAANVFFPVWIWEFSFTPLLLTAVIVVGYFCGVILIASIWHDIFKYNFIAISSIRAHIFRK
jgi:hypothetical protein